MKTKAKAKPKAAMKCDPTFCQNLTIRDSGYCCQSCEEMAANPYLDAEGDRFSVRIMAWIP